MRHFADQERRDRIARRHALAPEHRVGDAESAVRAMTVLHATEPPTVYLSVACRVDGVSVADVDAALFEDRTPGPPARDAAHAVRLPARPAAGGMGERRGPGRRPGVPQDRQGRRRRRAGRGRRGLAGGRAPRGARGPARRGARPHHHGDPGPGARGRRHRLRLPGHPVGRRDPDRPAGADPARRVRRDRPRRERQPLADLPAPLEADGPLAGRRTRAAVQRGGVRRAGAALADHVRTGHHHRHQVVAGLDARCGEAGAGAARGRRGVPGPGRDRLGAAGRPRRRPSRSSRGRRCCRCSTRP